MHSFDVCIYHKNCPDGIGGAFPFWRESKGFKRPGLSPNPRLGHPGYVVFIAMHPGADPDEEFYDSIRDKNVVMVDISFSEAVTLKVLEAAKFLRILDHHKSFHELILNEDSKVWNKRNLDLIFDQDRSGAQIAWDYVYPGAKRPWFIDIIADRDLWKWEIPDSKEIGNALYEFGWYTWEKMEELLTSDTLGPETFLERGKILAELNSIKVDKAVKGAVLRSFEGYTVALANGDPSLRSEIGHVAAQLEGVDFAAVWRYSEVEGQFFISLRGVNPDLPLDGICAKFGGGGHAQACGFAIHTPYSRQYRSLSDEEKKSRAFGSIHDYFKRMDAGE